MYVVVGRGVSAFLVTNRYDNFKAWGGGRGRGGGVKLRPVRNA